MSDNDPLSEELLKQLLREMYKSGYKQGGVDIIETAIQSLEVSFPEKFKFSKKDVRVLLESTLEVCLQNEQQMRDEELPCRKH